MRKYIVILIIAALLLIGGQPVFAATPGYRVGPGTGDILGQKKFQQDPHKIFRMVRYVQITEGDSALPADSMVIWDLSEDDGITVTTTTTSSDSAVAGIIVQQALTQDTNGNTAVQDVGKDNWTWLQTYGLSQVDNTAAVQSAGDAMGTGTTKGEANSHQGGEVDARAQGIAGFFYDSATSGATDVECFLTLD